ncbi:unnamed protein product [Vicia faba]|uniref:Uncharacterized protein n=1 Tax=Vicia faba TaxID=3906 RepID=A0AAV0YM53_VICFA|nr:unnamed protein product [Vicia faba]
MLGFTFGTTSEAKKKNFVKEDKDMDGNGRDIGNLTQMGRTEYGRKFTDIDEDFFQIKNDGDAYDFSAYACAMEGPIIVGLLPCPNKRKLEDEDYVSEELDNSDSDNSEDEKRSKFEKFRKERFNKNFKFKWGMQFNFLDDFRETIREWTILNGREIAFMKNEGYKRVDQGVDTEASSGGLKLQAGAVFFGDGVRLRGLESTVMLIHGGADGSWRFVSSLSLLRRRSLVQMHKIQLQM